MAMDFNDCTDKILTLCTSHLPHPDHSVLSTVAADEDERELALSEHISWENIDQGWWLEINFKRRRPPTKYEDRESMLNKAGMSLAFLDIIDRALNEGCRYIRFDVGEPECSDLPTFEWPTDSLGEVKQ